MHDLMKAYAAAMACDLDDDVARRASRIVDILDLPAHSSFSPPQDQHGHSVPSTSAIASLVASAASSAIGRSASVAFSTSGFYITL